jgi:hypothetical protein
MFEKIIIESQFGEHNLVLYSDIINLRYIYVKYCKIALESLNEIVLLLPYYDSTSYTLHNLRTIDIDIEKYKQEGWLIIVGSRNGYFSLKDELVGIMIMVKMLLQRSHKLGKSGLTVFSDIGLFFYLNRIEDLLKRETAVLLSIHNTKVKIFCCYNIADLRQLTENQKQDLLNHHNKVISTESQLI